LIKVCSAKFHLARLHFENLAKVLKDNYRGWILKM
jgi:hypothetical protein